MTTYQWIVLVCLMCTARAELFPISNGSYPYLVITDPSTVNVAWHTKSMAFRLAHSAAVRINSRGICFIPSVHTLHLSTQKGVQESLRTRQMVSNSSLSPGTSAEWLGATGEGALSDDKKHLVHESTAINSWRSVACIPSRQVACLLVWFAWGIHTYC
jgi:hypothetical protein